MTTLKLLNRSANGLRQQKVEKNAVVHNNNNNNMIIK